MLILVFMDGASIKYAVGPFENEDRMQAWIDRYKPINLHNARYTTIHEPQDTRWLIPAA